MVTNYKLKVAAYIRVSTDISDQENSFETQERYFEQLLSNNPDWVSAGIYSDYGISGTGKEKRIGFKRLLRHCQEGKINRIVCKSISRFARNTYDFLTALRLLQGCSVTILFEKEAMDTADLPSDFILTTLGAISQEESYSISSNINWGNQKRFPKGEVPNRELYGYRYNQKFITTSGGYKYKDIEVVAEEAEVVRRIFTEATQGVSYAQIARKLNEDGISAPETYHTVIRKKNPKEGYLNGDIDQGWTSKQVSMILKQERYVGDVLIQKNYTVDYLTHEKRGNNGEMRQYLVQNHHPAIVSRQLYEAVQKKIVVNNNKHGNAIKNKTPHTLSKRIICGECGRYYNARKYGVNTIWYCPSTRLNNGKTICHSEKIYEDKIIQIIIMAFSERFNQELAQIQTKLENIHNTDSMERDRNFYKRQIAAIHLTNENTRKRIRSIQDNMTDGGNKTENCHRLEEEESRLAEDEAEERCQMERLEYLENYWERLEKDYDCREKAIGWMNTLPSGDEGREQFINGMYGEYVKAFVFSVTIHSPIKYTVYWFDDITTLVEIMQ